MFSTQNSLEEFHSNGRLVKIQKAFNLKQSECFYKSLKY